jgi:hypothetical protein
MGAEDGDRRGGDSRDPRGLSETLGLHLHQALSNLVRQPRDKVEPEPVRNSSPLLTPHGLSARGFLPEIALELDRCLQTGDVQRSIVLIDFKLQLTVVEKMLQAGLGLSECPVGRDSLPLSGSDTLASYRFEISGVSALPRLESCPFLVINQPDCPCARREPEVGIIDSKQ